MKTQRGLHILLLLLLILALSVPTSAAAEKGAKTAHGSGKKKLLLFAKNPADWAIVQGGGNGRLIYRESSGVFSLTVSGLQPRSSYALIRYADAPPKAEILARGMSDLHGKLELSGVWRNWSKKFWLVSGDDVAGSAGGGGTLRAWHPERYLFEEKPLGIDCNCPEPEEPE